MPACLSKHLVPSYPISPTQIGYDNQDQVHMPIRKQQQLGIVSILDTSGLTTSLPYPQKFGNNTGSLRRTLSADMSSKKWLSNNGFSASPSPMMKRIGSSHDFHSFKGEEEMGRGGALDDIWSSMPKNRDGATVDHNQKSPTHFDTWSSIITSDKEDDVNGIASAPLPPAYVHPSVKRASSLSKKSLDTCTESLGSETGSDGFSSQPPSEPEPEGDSDSEEQQSRCSEDQEVVNKDELLPAFGGTGGEEIQVPKYNYYSNTASCKRVAPKSFPPPMPSLAHRDGTSLVHMRSLRENGRLVLEAVSVPSQNCLRARRQDGRLLLSLADATSEDKEIIDGDEFEENERTECEAEEREEEEESKYGRDKHDCVGIRAINGLTITTEDHQLVGKLPTGGLMIKMPRNGNYYSGCPPPDHHKRLNKVVCPDNVMNPEEENASEGLATTLPPSLPPRPRAVGRRIIANAASATAGSLNLNTYEYYWRKNINKTPPIAAAATWPTTTPDDACIPPRKAGIKEVERRKNQFINAAVLNEKPASPPTVVVDGKQQKERREYQVPLLMQQGCKEARRSLLFWEPYCIATT